MGFLFYLLKFLSGYALLAIREAQKLPKVFKPPYDLAGHMGKKFQSHQNEFERRMMENKAVSML